MAWNVIAVKRNWCWIQIVLEKALLKRVPYFNMINQAYDITVIETGRLVVWVQSIDAMDLTWHQQDIEQRDHLTLSLHVSDIILW